VLDQLVQQVLMEVMEQQVQLELKVHQV